MGGAVGMAIGTLAVSEFNDVAGHIHAKHAASAYESSRRIEAYHNCRRLTGIEKAYCEDQAARSAREQEREEYELEANQRQGIWSAASGTAAVFGVFFSLVTIAAIYLTYLEQQRANAVAREEFLHARQEAAAAAADRERQLRQADLTTRAQLRCYLNSEDETCSFDDTGAKVTLGYTYKNVGLTPAHEVMFAFEATFSRNEGEGEIRNLAEFEFPYGIVGPSAINHVPMVCRLNGAEVDAIAAGEGRVFASVAINYRDEFGDRWLFTQDMLVDESSKQSGIMYTSKCETVRLTEDEQQESNEELPLKGGHEGKEDA
jgi:hypothetical protein